MSADPAFSDDAAWLARWHAAATRDAAFEELFARLRQQVFAACLHITGNVADADDALQETFLAVHAGLAAFRAESRLSTWVHRIAICAALRVRARRRVTRDLDDVDPPAASNDDVLQQEFEQRLVAAMNRLTAEHRIVLSLFAVDGMSHGQIAEILGVPIGTVWSRLHAARKRLSEELGGG